MRNLMLSLMGLVILNACSNRIEVGPRGPGLRPGGDEVGNGGDAERVVFEMGRAHAQMVLESIGTGLTRESELAKVHGELLTELDPKVTKLIWTRQPPAHCPKTCGCTLPAKGEPIYLNVAYCSGYTPAAAGKLLLHEVSHHVAGSDEPTADRFASAAYGLWKSLGHPDEPHWKTIPEALFTIGTNSRAVWNGNELVVWDTVGTVAYYHPRRHSWRQEKAVNNFAEWFQNSRLQNHAGFFVDGKIASISECHGIVRKQGAGHFYDPATRTWTLIPSAGAPSARNGIVQQWQGKLVVWAGESCGGSYARARVDGGIWSPRTNTWEKIEAPKDLAPTFDISWTVTNTHLVAAIPGKSELWAYDFQTRTWSSTRLPDGIEITERTRSVTQGVEVLFLSANGKPGLKWNAGKVSRLASFPELNGANATLVMGNGILARGREFYFLDLAHNEWKAIPQLLSPPRQDDQSWHWIGSEAIVWDGAREPKGYLYYP